MNEGDQEHYQDALLEWLEALVRVAIIRSEKEND